MGGSTPGSGLLPSWAADVAAPFTGGTSLLLGPAGRDIGGGANTASNLSTAESQQNANANALNTTLLEQPKQVTPDNFLSSKVAQLANLKLGLASTVTGAGGAPAPVLGSTSLTGAGPGKTKLGS